MTNSGAGPVAQGPSLTYYVVIIDINTTVSIHLSLTHVITGGKSYNNVLCGQGQ